MTIKGVDVVEILGWLGTASVDIWLDGGWGVDALVGEQTREHNDLDLIVRDAHEHRMREALATHGFIQVDADPQNFVLADERGREVDVHPVRFDDQGNGHLLAGMVSHSDNRLRRSRRWGAFPDTASRVCPPKGRCRAIRGDTNRATPMSAI
jgi:Aminoglycoside-2''-adenylyltransferase